MSDRQTDRLSEKKTDKWMDWQCILPGLQYRRYEHHPAGIVVPWSNHLKHQTTHYDEEHQSLPSSRVVLAMNEDDDQTSRYQKQNISKNEFTITDYLSSLLKNMTGKEESLIHG